MLWFLLKWFHVAVAVFILRFRRYDDETDQVMNYQRIPLKDLDKIEIGSFNYIVSVVSIGMVVDYFLMFYDVNMIKNTVAQRTKMNLQYQLWK